MNRSSLTYYLVISLLIVPVAQVFVPAQTRRPPAGGRLAIVVDERLAALRDAPNLSARLVQRLSRGRIVAIRGATQPKMGVVFYKVNVTRRTKGWIQAEALMIPSRPGDDRSFQRLIMASNGFDRIVRARIFLNHFPHSPLRPAVLLALAQASEVAAERLSNEARRRLDPSETSATGAKEFSYFLNYSGLDRYNRQGIRFLFDSAEKRLLYDGAAWRELLQRYPHSPEAAEAQERWERRRPRLQ
jgi:hypothetical protein